MGQTNKKLRQDIEDAVSIISDSFQAINYWKNKDLCGRMIGFLGRHGIDITDRVWSSLIETEHTNKDTMDKHFEPVTARSLAEKIVDKAQQFSPWQTRASQKTAIESIIEPHIRKPSDDDKSVPARCEEAYNEALNLLASAADIITKIKEFDEPTEWLDDRRDFINKPNPFKEADIVHEDEKEPTLLPFSLEEAKNGVKVVTREMNDVKIVADDLTGNYPLLAVVSTGRVKVSCRYTIGGSTESQHPPMDLFILKEPETVEVSIYKNKYADLYRAAAYDEAPDSRFKDTNYELIKTIKVKI